MSLRWVQSKEDSYHRAAWRRFRSPVPSTPTRQTVVPSCAICRCSTPWTTRWTTLAVCPSCF